jgi:flagellar basal-body rod protein FlgG
MFNKVDMGPHMNLQRGTGMREYQTARIWEQGALQSTGRLLDLALEGRGFFVVENPQPMDEDGLDEIFFTRNGAFYLSVEEEGEFLVDSFGRYILDIYGERIMIPDVTLLQCDPTGLLYMTNEAGETVSIAQLALADFVNPGGLASAGEGVYMQTVNSVLDEDYPLRRDDLEGVWEEVAANIGVRQGFVEESNVDLAEEMPRLIRAQRAYQIAARAVTTADQMMQVANAIRS